MHQKHTKLVRPQLGNFGRQELSILGTPCGNIKKLAFALIQNLSGSLNITYVDADHKSADAEAAHGTNLNTALAHGAGLEYTDKITFQRFDYRQTPNEYEQKNLFLKSDLILVNGNHFAAQAQIVVVDPAKPLEKKLDKLTNVQLLLLADNVTEIPGFIRTHLPDNKKIPILRLGDIANISAFVRDFYKEHIPPLHGLVLAGGKSTRMQTDKGLLHYYQQDQRTHVYHLLENYCREVYVSCNAEQAQALAGNLPYLQDSFLNLGPKGGILTALQANPNVAWLTVACDLPLISPETLQYLVSHRDPTKMATAFYDSEGRFPEPLLTIWEPRSYSVLLQFLSQGYSCPRKALINSDVCLLHIPDITELRNVNDQTAYKQTVQDINNK